MNSKHLVRIVYLMIVTLLLCIFLPFGTVNANEIGVVGFVKRCYRIALGREAEEDGLQYWTNSLFSGETCGVSVAYGFVYSSEFQNAGYDNSTYVEKMYNMLLGREPDSNGKSYWVNNLSNGYTRYDIFMGFANSQEFYELCESYGIFSGFYLAGSDMNRVASINGFVDRLYYLCLGRHGDQGGQGLWASNISSGNTSGTMAAYGFFFSSEYLNKNKTNSEYVTDLYNVFFGRSPDSAGFNSWVEGLNKGTYSREEVLMGFSRSAEFYNLCLAYGINAGCENLNNYTYTPESSGVTTTPTNRPTEVVTYVPTVTAEPTYEAKETPDLSVPFTYDGKSYTVKSYKIDIDQEFLKLFHENFKTRTEFVYDECTYDLTVAYRTDYGLPIDLECDGTVYGFFLDDVSNELNSKVNTYRRENGWEEYAIIDYELCRLRAIEGTVGGFELGHYRPRGGAGGSQNMCWSWGIPDADYFETQYVNSYGHLAKWKGKGALNMSTATFVRVKWVENNMVEAGGYWEIVCCCNDQMFLPSSALLGSWGTYEVYSGMDSLLHDEDFDGWYNYFIVQGNVGNNYSMFTHLKKEDI